MSDLETRLAWTNPIQYLIEHNRAFRIQPPYAEMSLEPVIQASQRGEQIIHMLPYLEVSLRHKDMSDTLDNQLRAIELTFILQNLAWQNGSHLITVVSLAKNVLANQYPLIAKENSAAAVKNTAYYAGPHVDPAIRCAIEHGYSRGASKRVTDGCVRTILEAVKHLGSALNTDEVREFLSRAARDDNEIIADHALQAYTRIFG